MDEALHFRLVDDARIAIERVEGRGEIRGVGRDPVGLLGADGVLTCETLGDSLWLYEEAPGIFRHGDDYRCDTPADAVFSHDGCRLHRGGHVNAMVKQKPSGPSTHQPTPVNSMQPCAWLSTDSTAVAKACVALLSDWFPSTTGEIVHVDGGYHAMAGPLPAIA